MLDRLKQTFTIIKDAARQLIFQVFFFVQNEMFIH